MTEEKPIERTRPQLLLYTLNRILLSLIVVGLFAWAAIYVWSNVMKYF